MSNKAAEDCAAVTGHAENKQGPSAAGGDGGEADEEDKTEEAGKIFCRDGARSTPEEGGEDEEEAFDHENVEEQFSDSHCPLKYFHQAMKQLCDGKYQDTLILDCYPDQHQARTRASQRIEAEMMDSNVEIVVLSNLRNLCSTLADKIESDTVGSD